MKNDEKCDQSTVMLSLEIIKSWNVLHCVQMVPISSYAVQITLQHLSEETRNCFLFLKCSQDLQ